MATRTLLKLKPNLNLPLRLFRNPTLSMTRPVSHLARPDPFPISLFGPSAVHFPGTLARRMATSRSPRGASKRNEEEDEDDDDEVVDDGDEDVFDVDDEYFDDDGDGDAFDDEEEEKPKGKKKTSW